MTVLTNRNIRLKRPRCEAINSKHQRCAFSGQVYSCGKWLCRHHVAKALKEARARFVFVDDV